MSVTLSLPCPLPVILHLSHSVAQRGDRCHSCRLTGSTKHRSREVIDLLSVLWFLFDFASQNWTGFFHLFGLVFRIYIYSFYTRLFLLHACFACMHCPQRLEESIGSTKMELQVNVCQPACRHWELKLDSVPRQRKRV